MDLAILLFIYLFLKNVKIIRKEEEETAWIRVLLLYKQYRLLQVEWTLSGLQISARLVTSLW